MQTETGQMALLAEQPHKPFKKGTQLDRVHSAMMDAEWLTLAAIAYQTGIPETTIGSRVRDLRKPKGHEHVIRVKESPNSKKLHLYRMEERHEHV